MSRTQRIANVKYKEQLQRKLQNYKMVWKINTNRTIKRGEKGKKTNQLNEYVRKPKRRRKSVEKSKKEINNNKVRIRNKWQLVDCWIKHIPFSSGAFLYFSKRFTAIASNRTLAAGYSFKTSHISFLLNTKRSL